MPINQAYLSIPAYGIPLVIGDPKINNLKNSLLIIALFFLPLLASASSGDENSKVKNLFVFRTDKKFVGAKIEVFGVAGDLLTTQMLQKRKMIIDFGTVEWGSYTIRVTKEGKVKEFKYIKKN